MAAEAKIKITAEDNASDAINRIAGSAKTLEQVVSAQALIGFAETLSRWATEGDRASDVLGSFALNMAGLQRATAGTVDAMTLAEASNRALSAGLNLSQREMEAVAAAAANYARVTGVDANAAMNQLTAALISGRERGLRPFGIQASDTSSAIRALVGRLGENESALNANSGAFDRASADAANLKTQFQQLAADGVETFLNAIGLIGSRTEEQMGRAFASAQSFATRFNAIAVSIGNALGFTEGMSEGQIENWAGTAEGVAAFRQRGLTTQGQRDQFLRMARRFGRDPREMLGQLRPTESGQREIADNQRTVDEAAAQADWQDQERRHHADQDAAAAAAGSRRRGGGGGGGGGRRRAANDGPERLESPYEALLRANREEGLEELEDLYLRRTGQAGGAVAPMGSSNRGGVGNNRGSTEGRNRRGGTGDVGTPGTVRNLSAIERAYESLGQTGTEVLDALGAATSRHFEAWAMGRETFGDALAGMTADLFKWMGQQALKKAGMEAVEAIAAAARYDFGGAALHTAAAIGFGALAGGSLYVAGQVAPGKSSTHGRDDASTGRSSTRDLGARGESGGGAVLGSLVINIAPAGLVGPNSAELLARIVVNGINEGVNRGGMPRLQQAAIHQFGSRG